MYIYNIIGYYNHSVRIIDVVSHTTYMLYVLILLITGGTCNLKSTLNDILFEKLFMAILFIAKLELGFSPS